MTQGIFVLFCNQIFDGHVIIIWFGVLKLHVREINFDNTYFLDNIVKKIL